MGPPPCSQPLVAIPEQPPPRGNLVDMGNQSKGDFYFSFGGSWAKALDLFTESLKQKGGLLGGLFKPQHQAPVMLPQQVVEHVQVVDVQPVRVVETPVYVDAPPIEIVDVVEVEQPPLAACGQEEELETNCVSARIVPAEMSDEPSLEGFQALPRKVLPDAELSLMNPSVNMPQNVESPMISQVQFGAKPAHFQPNIKQNLHQVAVGNMNANQMPIKYIPYPNSKGFNQETLGEKNVYGSLENLNSSSIPNLYVKTLRDTNQRTAAVSSRYNFIDNLLSPSPGLSYLETNPDLMAAFGRPMSRGTDIFSPKIQRRIHRLALSVARSIV